MQNTIVRDLVPPGETTGVTCSGTWAYLFCEQGPMVPHLVPPPIPRTGGSIHREFQQHLCQVRWLPLAHTHRPALPEYMEQLYRDICLLNSCVQCQCLAPDWRSLAPMHSWSEILGHEGVMLSFHIVSPLGASFPIRSNRFCLGLARTVIPLVSCILYINYMSW